MNVPNKIYVPYLIYGTWKYTIPNPDDETEVEYICKDNLLEWAKNMKRICQGAEPLEKAYQTIIDKLNSM